MKTFSEFINESTTATITVLSKGVYKTSFLQADGYLEGAGKELLKNYNDEKSAAKLATGTGEIRSIFKLEYYSDRKLLEVGKDEGKAAKAASEAHIKYFFDGTDWFYGKGQIRDFSSLKKLEDLV